MLALRLTVDCLGFTLPSIYISWDRLQSPRPITGGGGGRNTMNANKLSYSIFESLIEHEHNKFGNCIPNSSLEEHISFFELFMTIITYILRDQNNISEWHLHLFRMHKYPSEHWYSYTVYHLYK